MKKALVVMFLVLSATISFAQQPAGQKTLKDSAEYNTYMAALNTQDPAAKGAAMDAFVQQYPQSILLSDALEQAMNAYQSAGNMAKVEEDANRILQVAPNNVRALAIAAFIARSKATGGDQAALKQVCATSQTGLQQLPAWPKPDGVSDADFQTVKIQMTDIFNGAAGFCALQNKDYANARSSYMKAVQIDATNLQDVYQLAVAGLQLDPIDVSSLWYCGKAIQLGQKMNNTQAVMSMVAFCKYKYHHYHGADDGWDQLVAQAATENALPANFAANIKPAPTPCDLAVQAVQQNDPVTLSIGDWEYVLSKSACSSANKQAADKVWQVIQDKQKSGEVKMKIPMKVISATKEGIEAAITDENQEANKADLHVVFEKPVLTAPAAGTTVNVIGVITSYTADPFMFNMEKAELVAARAPARK